MIRTHRCGQLQKIDIDQKVILCGWVASRRDHGNLIFIDLRDRWGITQIVFDPETNAELHARAEKLRSEFVIRVDGLVAARPEGTTNPKIPTGEIEVRVHEMEVLNAAETPPFEIDDAIDVSEELRLKYRYLDLRRPRMRNNLITRSKVTSIARQYFDSLDFLEIETPYLTKSTPEGARDFLVPSRMTAGTFYALPQSPQLFKQILMAAGMDRYYQIVRCFRDEDLRADRQLEHTQIDVEMSFVNEEDILGIIEGLISRIFLELKGVKIEMPLPRMPYADAMNRFGSDKPDIRFAMELCDVTEALLKSESQIFEHVFNAGGVARAICVKGGAAYSRKDLEQFEGVAKDFGAKGLAWFKVQDQIESPVRKFFTDQHMQLLQTKTSAQKGDLILIVASDWRVACTAVGAVRMHIAKRENLIPKDQYSLHWVTEFPMFEWNAEEARLQALHHPFTSPFPEDLDKLDTEPLAVKARAYDLILNGVEAGGGSIRIHRPDIQSKVFSVMGISEKEAEEKFSFLLNAFRYGAPPHGGIALGLDRLVALLLGEDSIREVIAFPKTQKGICPMSEAPSVVDPKQLQELSIRIKQ